MFKKIEQSNQNMIIIIVLVLAFVIFTMIGSFIYFDTVNPRNTSLKKSTTTITSRKTTGRRSRKSRRTSN